MPKKLYPTTDSRASHVQLQLNLPLRILVADHDPYVSHLSADVLIWHGYEVNVVEDGEAVWEELQANDYNLLITEHDLPKISGVKLIKKLRAASLSLPVVMIADELPTRELTRNPSLQLAATLLKPLPSDVLIDTVKFILRSRLSQEQIVPPQLAERFIMR